MGVSKESLKYAICVVWWIQVLSAARLWVIGETPLLAF
jgi:hypothetical protein